ncbi:MAG: VWA-like domain-containing protein [bacterium]|nr:VWA-like domain-containing protein [bacterium]
MEDKLANLARDVLILARNTLLVNLRFLDAALGQFSYIPIPNNTILTDGEHIFYQPLSVLKSYRMAKEIPVRNYLHMVLHCVFRHMYVNPTVEHTYWDLACDIAVENIITELNLKTVKAPREEKQRAYIEELRNFVKQMTAEKLYVYLKENVQDAQTIKEMQEVFAADEHFIWYQTEKKKERLIRSYSGNGNTEGNGDQDGIDNEGEGEGEDGERNENEGKSQNGKNAMSELWKQISERIQVDLETFSRRQGFGSGSMTQNLMEVNREKYDYTAFLKKFAVLGEAMRVNDDEFDYIFYTYGLKRYGNMPLIEPLEYKEVKRIREFAIAIDTSGSVQGELVQKFIQKTYNILKSTESFFSKINLHIIQCDANIQEDVKITSQREFDAYLQNMQLKGFGGTDFRPVFHYVDELLRNKEFVNLKGLLYFTDGYGSFPQRKPDYETAFVFLEEDYELPEVPPWAIRLVLQREEV